MQECKTSNRKNWKLNFTPRCLLWVLFHINFEAFQRIQWQRMKSKLKCKVVLIPMKKSFTEVLDFSPYFCLSNGGQVLDVCMIQREFCHVGKNMNGLRWNLYFCCHCFLLDISVLVSKRLTIRRVHFLQTLSFKLRSCLESEPSTRLLFFSVKETHYDLSWLYLCPQMMWKWTRAAKEHILSYRHECWYEINVP